MRFTQKPVSQPPFFLSLSSSLPVSLIEFCLPFPHCHITAYSCWLLLLSIHLLCFALPAFHFYRRVFYKLLSRDVLDLLRRCTRYVDKVVLFRSVISVFAMVEFKTISLTRDLKQSRPSHSTPLWSTCSNPQLHMDPTFVLAWRSQQRSPSLPSQDSWTPWTITSRRPS